MTERQPSSLLPQITIGVGAIACFAIFTWLRNGDSDFGATATFSMLAIVFAASVRWDLRKKWYYWATLGLVSLAHVILVMRADLVPHTPTITAAPLVILDFTLIVILLSWLDRVLTAESHDRD